MQSEKLVTEAQLVTDLLSGHHLSLLHCCCSVSTRRKSCVCGGGIEGEEEAVHTDPLEKSPSSGRGLRVRAREGELVEPSSPW